MTSIYKRGDLVKLPLSGRIGHGPPWSACVYEVTGVVHESYGTLLKLRVFSGEPDQFFNTQQRWNCNRVRRISALEALSTQAE